MSTKVGIFYGTDTGRTRRIAKLIAQTLVQEFLAASYLVDHLRGAFAKGFS